MNEQSLFTKMVLIQQIRVTKQEKNVTTKQMNISTTVSNKLL